MASLREKLDLLDAHADSIKRLTAQIKASIDPPPAKPSKGGLSKEKRAILIARKRKAMVKIKKG